MGIRKPLPLLAAAVLYAVAVLFCWSAKDEANGTYLLLSVPVDAARAEDIFTREAALAGSEGFCFWGEQENQRISCKETGGTAEVTRLLLSGNPGLLDAGVLAWQEGCFLDEATARMLFGTADCARQTVWYDDRPYRVFGTISTTRPTMLAVADRTDGLVLNRCALDAPAETGQQTARQFLLRWGLAGEEIRFFPLWVAVYDFLLILPGILVFHFYFYGKSRTRSRGKRGILLLFSIGLLLLLGSRFLFPPDMFPSRWSDFSFWGNWWKEQQRNFQLVLLTPLGERHLQMLLDMVKSLICSIVSFLLVIWSICRTKAETLSS